MSKERSGPRKPATKFPQLRKQMQKNSVGSQQTVKQFGPPPKRLPGK
jgi:hypothetical protein